MKHTILAVQSKSPDWKIVTAKDMANITVDEISVNRIDKKSGLVAFPDFDLIAAGYELEATLWRSDSGKAYLFAPKPKTAVNANSGATGASRGVAAAQQRKGDMIEKSMDRKELGIMLSSAMRAATDITLASLNNQPFPTDADFAREFKKYKDWYIKTWKITSKELDVPFESEIHMDEFDGPGKGENRDHSWVD